MKVAPPTGGPGPLQPFDFAPQSHDLRLQGRQGQIVARAGECQQPGQTFRFAERDDRFGKPLVLVGYA
jgi:hypothetical protein